MSEIVEPIFQDLKAGVENMGATEIESLCVNCFENVGTAFDRNLSRIFLTTVSTLRATRGCC